MLKIMYLNKAKNRTKLIIFEKKKLKWIFLSSVKFCVGQNFADAISFKDIKSFLIKKIKTANGRCVSNNFISSDTSGMDQF